MCGLLAFVGAAAHDAADAVADASQLMRHRGPDEPGTWADDNVVFGFNRLSIIDIAHSHQPLRWGHPKRRTGMCWCSTERSTTTWSYAPNSPPATAPYLPPTVTVKPSSPPTTTGVWTRWPGCGVCSRSPSGTLSLANCSAPVILSASNRCSSRPEAVASRWLARRSACWSLRR
ncbi:asparagine synthase domain protein [Mycobacterium xenopi 3993]|nr:asparagine synthase domain protein [Mycobacterium xenopi 3993]